MKRGRKRTGRKLTCCKCGKLKERPSQGYCNSCRNEWSSKNRPIHSDLPEEQRKKATARSYLNVYIKYGKVKKGNCFCGEPGVEAHHEDYSKPLEVTWYCRKHHLELHNKK